MKKITVVACCLLLVGNFKISAQSWSIGGNTLSSSQRIGTNNGYSIIFETNGSDRGRITSGGNWGIGTTDPTAKLHVNSTVTGQTPFRVQVLGSTRFLVNSSGNVAIGTTSPSSYNKLSVINNSGTGIYTKGDFYGLQAECIDPNGYGIRSSGYIAVYGTGSAHGTYGISDYTGAYGEGDTYGVRGFTYDGTGVSGFSTNQYGGEFSSFDGTGLRAGSTNGFYAAIFDGNTYAYGSYYGSDKNIKKNIQEVGKAMILINQLKPKYYQFRDDGKFAGLHLPKGNHYGLLAQDVEEVLPNLVKESAHELRDLKAMAGNKPDAKEKMADPVSAEAKEFMNIKAVNYLELIPIMIKALQEQQQENDDLRARIAKLEAANTTGGPMYNTDLIHVSLEQNQPNPASQSTTFRYTIPANADAQILVYDALSGKLVKTLPAPSTGQVQMDGSDLKAGNYIYTLSVNGKVAASKQMVILK